MDANVRAVLEVLYPLGVGIENDIANPLRTIFPITSRTDPNLPHQISVLQRFLNYLAADNLIYISDKSSYLALGQDHPEGGKRYLNGSWPISAAMTLKAYNELERLYEKERGEDLDGSVKYTNLVSRRNIRATVAVSTLALLVSGVTLLKDVIWPEPTEISPIPTLQEINSTLRNNRQELNSLNQILFDIQKSLNQSENVSRISNNTKNKKTP